MSKQDRHIMMDPNETTLPLWFRQGTLEQIPDRGASSKASVLNIRLSFKSMVAILRIRTLAAFANAFRVRPLNHSGRIAGEAMSKLNFQKVMYRLCFGFLDWDSTSLNESRMHCIDSPETWFRKASRSSLKNR